MRDQRLTVAEWLLEAGAGQSAISLLGDLLGQQANQIRRLAKHTALHGRTVYALVVDQGRGVLVPLKPSPGRSRARDPELRLACDRGLDAARRVLGVPHLPALRFELEEWLSLFGSSLGLPAMLAFLGYYAPRRLPDRAILATGKLLDGELGAVDAMPAKRAIAAAERGEKLLVTPELFGSVDEAVVAVFGAEPVLPERHVLTLDQTIERARLEVDREKAIAELEALPLEPLAESDQARVLLEIGTLCRHAGESDRASAFHARARALLDSQRRFIGAEAAERYELECHLSEMDEFRIDDAIDALSARLAAPFLAAHNEVRCRGMLAQALGMAGRHAEAVSVRLANVELQQSTEALRAVLPGTYCYLALDSAKAGDAEAFDRWRREVEKTPAGSETQWRFNAAAIVRGLVALHRYEEAIAWTRDRTRLLLSEEPIATHPETSLVRALCRAYKRTDTSATPLAERVPLVEQTLVGWLCALVHVEANPTPELQVSLHSLHAAATAFHRELTSTTGAALERALDAVWY